MHVHSSFDMTMTQAISILGTYKYLQEGCEVVGNSTIGYYMGAFHLERRLFFGFYILANN